MAPPRPCPICRVDQVSATCCRCGLLPRSRSGRLRHRAVGGEDRISDLPDDLLLLFLERLGCARAAAHTGLLSRRWRDLWAILPELTFHNTAPDQIEAALTQFSRPSLSLLDIHVPEHHSLEPPGVTSLLLSAARVAPAELKVKFSVDMQYSSAHAPYPVDVVDVDLPCFAQTTSIFIEMYTHDPLVRLVLPLAGDFLKFESLSLCSCDVDIADLLPRCPKLRKLYIQRSTLLKLAANSPSLEELDVTTESVLQSVEIRGPLLKKLSIHATLGISDEFSLTYSAPTLEDLSWKCDHEYYENVGFGIWRLSILTFETAKPLGDKGSTCLQPEQHCPRIDTVSLCIWTNGPTEDVPVRSFRQLMSQLHVANFFTLELDISTRGHAYGELLLHLLMASRTAQRIKLKLRDVGLEECTVDCGCDQPNNWRSQTVPMTSLKEIEIQDFRGEAQEIDLLKLIFRSATMLERVTIAMYSEISQDDNGFMKTCGILKAHPSVESTICYY